MEMKKIVRLKREPKKGFGEAECPMCGKMFILPAPNAIRCEECRDIANGHRSRRTQTLRSRGLKLQDGSLPSDLPPSRKCHDCGRPTNNYRCAECWAKKVGECDDNAGEEYSVCIGSGIRR